MRKYWIFTDTSCDLPPQELRRLGVTCLPLILTINGVEYSDAIGNMPDVDKFYQMQKECSGQTKTSGLNQMAIMEAFELVLKEDIDILYLGISPDLSEATWNSMNIVVSELREEYPDRRIEIPNTHSVASGLGRMITEIATLRDTGACLDQTMEQVELIAKEMVHLFTVDDFKQLKRSGRVSSLKATVADVMQVRPILHLPYEGIARLKKKVTGRDMRRVLKTLATMVHEAIKDDEKEVWVSYGDSGGEWAANKLSEFIWELCSNVKISLHRIGPVTGAHTGGTAVGAFFRAKER
ncbi:DegV family protein [Candidatus Saccharibacteria bacterium]|nr:DegV family protein [Candidatus Saccharibacteria bacterium]